MKKLQLNIIDNSYVDIILLPKSSFNAVTCNYVILNNFICTIPLNLAEHIMNFFVSDCL